MMSTLKSFLKEQAREQRATEAERRQALEEWKRALDSLISRLEHWLHEADPANVLKVERIPVTIREQGLGIYEVEGLRVWLKYRDFRVEPLARYPGRPFVEDERGDPVRDGMVTMDGAHRKFALYRRQGEGGDEWTIIDRRTRQPRGLDQSTFEDAVYKLLK
jgi:hypothetical protein